MLVKPCKNRVFLLEYAMKRLAIGDRLIVRQSKLDFVSDWSFQLINLANMEIVTQQSNINSEAVFLTLSLDNFGEYLGKTLLLEVTSDVLESDLLLISGIYSKLEEIELLNCLLGENLETTFSNYQDGFEKTRQINCYSDDDFTIEIGQYTWSREFVKNFIPDHRYQDNKITQVLEA